MDPAAPFQIGGISAAGLPKCWSSSRPADPPGRFLRLPSAAKRITTSGLDDLHGPEPGRSRIATPLGGQYEGAMAQRQRVDWDDTS